MVEHYVRDVGAGGSNPLTPTNFAKLSTSTDINSLPARAVAARRPIQILYSDQSNPHLTELNIASPPSFRLLVANQAKGLASLILAAGRPLGLVDRARMRARTPTIRWELSTSTDITSLPARAVAAWRPPRGGQFKSSHSDQSNPHLTELNIASPPSFRLLIANQTKGLASLVLAAGRPLGLIDRARMRARTPTNLISRPYRADGRWNVLTGSG